MSYREEFRVYSSLNPAGRIFKTVGAVATYMRVSENIIQRWVQSGKAEFTYGSNTVRKIKTNTEIIDSPGYSLSDFGKDCVCVSMCVRVCVCVSVCVCVRV